MGVDIQTTERELLRIMDAGQTLEEAVRILFEKGYGLLFLSKATASIRCIDFREATRAVLAATSALRERH